MRVGAACRVVFSARIGVWVMVSVRVRIPGRVTGMLGDKMRLVLEAVRRVT